MLFTTLFFSSTLSLALAQVPGGPWTLSDGTCPGGQNAEAGNGGSGNSQCDVDQWPQWCCPGNAINGNGCDTPACVVGTQTIPITENGYLTSVYLAAGTTLGGTATTTGTAATATRSSTGGAAALVTAAPVAMAGAWAGFMLI